MPDNIIDVDAFTDPVVVPEPGDDRTSASVRTPFQALANRTRNNRNRIAAIEPIVTGLHADPHAWTGAHSWDQDIHVDGSVYVEGTGSGEFSYSNSDGIPLPRFRQYYIAPTPQGDWNRDTIFYAASTEVPSKPIDLRIDKRLVPSGSRLLEVAALVRQGADATAGTPMNIQLWRVSPSGTGVPVLAAVNTSIAGSDLHPGTAATREMIEVACDEAIANMSSFLVATVLSSSVAAGGSKDLLYWWRITISDPGPRNF